MADTKRTAAKKAAMTKNRKGNEGEETDSSNSKEVKVVVEIRIPQLEAQATTLSENRFSSLTRASAALLPAVVKITPVRDIHVVEIDVNAKNIVKDLDVGADQTHIANGQVSPDKPVFLFIHVTGIPNTQIVVVLEFDGKEIFNSPIHIDPNSGRIVTNQIIL
jgi:hypothetical protein